MNYHNFYIHPFTYKCLYFMQKSYQGTTINYFDPGYSLIQLNGTRLAKGNMRFVWNNKEKDNFNCGCSGNTHTQFPRRIWILWFGNFIQFRGLYLLFIRSRGWTRLKEKHPIGGRIGFWVEWKCFYSKWGFIMVFIFFSQALHAKFMYIFQDQWSFRCLTIIVS